MTRLYRNSLMGKPARDRFGRADGVDPARFFVLPVAMQAEGLRLLEEAGVARGDICRRFQLPMSEVTRLIDREHDLHRRTSPESGGENA